VVLDEHLVHQVECELACRLRGEQPSVRRLRARLVVQEEASAHGISVGRFEVPAALGVPRPVTARVAVVVSARQVRQLP
jgi:hypothetical protein